jgi:hypothetical protein
MSREIRRVPLDFDWPLQKPWEGFFNPHDKECPETGKTCFGGETAAATWLEAIARLIALVGEQAAAEPHADALRARGRLYPHPYLVEWPQAPRTRAGDLHPFGGEDLVQLVTGLADGERPNALFGSDSYSIMKTLLKAAGLPETWGRCPVCDGEGDDPASREAAEAWRPTEPPEGPGWQLWESTSLGSPISAVHPDEASFRAYLLGEGYSPGSVDEFIRLGWSHTASIDATDGTVRRDIEALAPEQG